jgi:hypothetical protein
MLAVRVDCSHMDQQREDRRRTLETLVQLASESNPAGCWDDGRAEALLRSQSTPEEVRAAGMDEAMIRRIWPESDER